MAEVVDGRPDQVLFVYDLKTGRKAELGQVEINVYGLRLSSDSKKFFLFEVSGGSGGRDHDFSGFTCFDVANEKLLWHFPWKAHGPEFAISPDGRRLVWGEADKKAGVVHVLESDAATGQPSERVLRLERVEAKEKSRGSDPPC